jgi:hypothetical protein
VLGEKRYFLMGSSFHSASHVCVLSTGNENSDYDKNKENKI